MDRHDSSPVAGGGKTGRVKRAPCSPTRWPVSCKRVGRSGNSIVPHGGACRIVILLVFSVMMSHRAALAAEWYATPAARVVGEYNDNPRLLTSGADAVWGAIFEASAVTGVRTELTEVDLKSRFRFLRFPSEESLNSDDQFFDLNASHKLENTDLLFFGNYSRDGTRTSELEDTGRVQINKRRIHWNLAPRVIHRLTLRTGLEGGLDYQDVKYDDSGSTGLIDFTYSVADGGVFHQLSERSLLRVTGLFSHYDAPDGAYEADGYGIMGGIEHRFSETMQTRVNLGVTSYDIGFSSAGIPQSATDTVVSGIVEFSKDFELTRLIGSLSNVVRPSGSGQLRERTQLLFEVRHKLSSQLSGNARVQIYTDSSLKGGTSADRDFIRFETWFRHQITRQWSLKASYRYLKQQSSAGRASADSNSVFLDFIYNGSKYATSR